MPEGSVLGPLLFILYTADLITLIEDLGFRPHADADGTQVHGSCRPDSADQLQLNLSTACLAGVSDWMRANRLQLNTSNTEILWCTTSRLQHRLPVAAIQVGTDNVHPSTCVRDLRIYIDSDVSMRTQVTRTVVGGFCVLRRLRTIRRSVYQTLSSSLCLCRWYSTDWISAIRRSPVCQLTSIAGCSLNAAA